MKHLCEYIFENLINEVNFSGKNWSHNGKYDYAEAVLNDIIYNNVPIGLGKSSINQYIKFNLSEKDVHNLEEFKSQLISKSYKDFDNELLKLNYIIYDDKDCKTQSNNQNLTSLWTNIFKGVYSGYVNGLSSKNKGNAFEKYFYDNYSKFENDIKSIILYDKLNSISIDGGLNQKRPLTFSKDSITCGKIKDNNFDIGETVRDITLNVDNDKNIYLSLKSGNSVTFVNSGIKTLFNDKFFNGSPLEGNGKLLLNMLCIEENKFREVFTSYDKNNHKSKAQKENVNIYKELKNNKTFEKFIKSVIGYGFIMVHQINGDNFEYINLLSADDLNIFISSMKDAWIEYPQNGEAKRVDVYVIYDKIKIKINLRSKDGSIYPTHIMADYKFINVI